MHFSVPHLPFVFDADGYNPPFNPLRTSPDDAYVRQLRYVDRLVGEIIGHMERPARSTARPSSSSPITASGSAAASATSCTFRSSPSGPGSASARADIPEQQHGELLLRDVVGASCPVQTAP